MYLLEGNENITSKHNLVSVRTLFRKRGKDQTYSSAVLLSFFSCFFYSGGILSIDTFIDNHKQSQSVHKREISQGEFYSRDSEIFYIPGCDTGHEPLITSTVDHPWLEGKRLIRRGLWSWVHGRVDLCFLVMDWATFVRHAGCLCPIFFRYVRVERLSGFEWCNSGPAPVTVNRWPLEYTNLECWSAWPKARARTFMTGDLRKALRNVPERGF